VFGGFIRGRQGIAIDGNALPLGHVSLFLWHDRVLTFWDVQATSGAQAPGRADRGHNGASVQGNRESSKYQIPPDLVVKFQTIDIVEVI
jgi:hypothetical protein